MRYRTRSVTWHGQVYTFERMHPKVPSGDIALWAVSRGRELIGTMPCAFEVTTKEFEVRGRRWLQEMLDDGPRPGG